MEIGSHGMHHSDWRKLQSTMLHVEVDACRRRIEDVCGKVVTKVAIPFGSYDRHVLKHCALSDTIAHTRARGDWLNPMRG
jgi:peptidoglycan/xylan/chitin deacetylase (PgdA/CDA1 family)